MKRISTRKVAGLSIRKKDHIKINLENDVNSGMTNGLENYIFLHNAMPEIDFNSIDLQITLFKKQLLSPILISSMTGGTKNAGVINNNLAEAAQECGIAMGVGSQRIGIEDPKQIPSFSITRKIAPNILLFANLGAVQLNNGYGLDECRRAVDMIQADALIFHLNPLQEAIQAGGDTNFAGLAKKIEFICKHVMVPVIAKEVGWGISQNTARVLIDSGIAAIDVAGAGGTSWSQVEMYRSHDEYTRNLAAPFINWGIQTAEALVSIRNLDQGILLIASGGLKNGLHIAKTIALGASLGGMAGQFLKAATVSTRKVVELIKLTEAQIRTTMFAVGAKNIVSLQNTKLINQR
jgi:isopentenyl-diphosphate Delta-isomerase